MVWCLKAQSHYLNQCWLLRQCTLWHSLAINFTGSSFEFNNYSINDTKCKYILEPLFGMLCKYQTFGTFLASDKRYWWYKKMGWGLSILCQIIIWERRHLRQRVASCTVWRRLISGWLLNVSSTRVLCHLRVLLFIATSSEWVSDQV